MFCYGGPHLEHGAYPRRFASDSLTGMLDLLRYEQLPRWYFFPSCLVTWAIGLTPVFSKEKTDQFTHQTRCQTR